MLAGFDDCLALIFLLDVHVKGIEVQFECLAANILDHLQSLIAGVDEIGFKPVQRLQADHPAPFFSISAEGLEVLDHGFPLLGILFGRNGVRTAHCRIHRPDERRTVQDHHLVNQCFHVGQALLLLFGRPSQISVRGHAGANRSTNQAVAVQSGLHRLWVDVAWVLHRNFDGVETPFLEFGKQGSASGGKGRGE